MGACEDCGTKKGSKLRQGDLLLCNKCDDMRFKTTASSEIDQSVNHAASESEGPCLNGTLTQQLLILRQDFCKLSDIVNMLRDENKVLKLEVQQLKQEINITKTHECPDQASNWTDVVRRKIKDNVSKVTTNNTNLQNGIPANSKDNVKHQNSLKSNNISIKASAKNEHLMLEDIFIGGVDVSNTEKDIDDHLTKLGVHDAKIRKLRSHPDKSFCISVQTSFYSKVMNKENWPKDVTVSRFIHQRRKNNNNFHGRKHKFQNYANTHSGKFCWNCGESNHIQSNCRFGQKVVCDICGIAGHKRKFCTEGY
jgi:hypothetical protein